MGLIKEGETMYKLHLQSFRTVLVPATLLNLLGLYSVKAGSLTQVWQAAGVQLLTPCRPDQSMDFRTEPVTKLFAHTGYSFLNGTL